MQYSTLAITWVKWVVVEAWSDLVMAPSIYTEVSKETVNKIFNHNTHEIIYYSFQKSRFSVAHKDWYAIKQNCQLTFVSLSNNSFNKNVYLKSICLKIIYTKETRFGIK